MDHDGRVAIIGLGYVGLPLAIAFEEAGLQVVGIDASETRIAELRGGTSPIDDISDERLGTALANGLRISSPAEAGLRDADAIFVCVPTPITDSKDPDLGPVLAAGEAICGSLRAGHLVILQSTTFPGTTNGPFREVLERSGLVAGRDFDLAFAPERVNPGDRVCCRILVTLGGSGEPIGNIHEKFKSEAHVGLGGTRTAGPGSCLLCLEFRRCQRFTLEDR